MAYFEWIDLYGKLAIALALVCLLPAHWRMRRWEKAGCVVAIWIESICLDRFQSSLMLVHTLLLGLLLIRKKRSFGKSVSGAMSAIFTAWAFMALCGSILTLCFYRGISDIAFECLSSTLLILFGFLWRKAGRTKKKETAPLIEMYRMVLELAIMVFFSLVLPLLWQGNDRGSAVMILALLVLLGIVYLCMHKMNILALEYQRSQLHEQEIERQYRKTVEIRHHFQKLFDLLGQDLARKDLGAASRHFESHIGPVYREIYKEGRNMKLKSELFDKLIQDALQQIHLMNGVQTEIEIEADVVLDENDINLFKIMTVWLDNAVEALDKQQDGYFCLKIKQTDQYNRLLIYVANSVDENVQGYYDMMKENRLDRGYGLAMAEDLIYCSSTMLHDCYVSQAVSFHKPLFVQQLMIG